MSQPETLMRISNADLVVNWFGGWPTFHDAEVISLQLCRDGPSLRVELYTFEVSRETESNTGCFKRDKECHVTIEFDDIDDLALTGFNHQNVLDSLRVAPVAERLEVCIDSIFGAGGRFTCAAMRVLSVLSVLEAKAGSRSEAGEGRARGGL